MARSRVKVAWEAQWTCRHDADIISPPVSQPVWIPQSIFLSRRIVFHSALCKGLITKWSAVTVPLCPSPLRLPLDIQTTQQQPGLTWMPLYGSGGKSSPGLPTPHCRGFAGGERLHSVYIIEARRTRRGLWGGLGVDSAALCGFVWWCCHRGAQKAAGDARSLHASFTGCSLHRVTALTTYAVQWIIRHRDGSCVDTAGSQMPVHSFGNNNKKDIKTTVRYHRTNSHCCSHTSTLQTSNLKHFDKQASLFRQRQKQKPTAATWF